MSRHQATARRVPVLARGALGALIGIARLKDSPFERLLQAAIEKFAWNFPAAAARNVTITFFAQKHEPRSSDRPHFLYSLEFFLYLGSHILHKFLSLPYLRYSITSGKGDVSEVPARILNTSLQLHVGGCQNYGPCWGTLNNRCRNILGHPKTDHNFDNHPCVCARDYPRVIG